METLLIDSIFEIENKNGYSINKHDISCFLGNLENNADSIKEKLNKNKIYNFIEHGERIREPTFKLALEMGFSKNEAIFTAYAAKLHDIGKEDLPKFLLLKPTGLTQKESREFRNHPIYGERAVDLFPELAKSIRYHHEWYNGTGYPDKLKDKEIPIYSLIIAVTECWDAMTVARPYSKIKSVQKAIKELEEGAKKQFDPSIVHIFLKKGLYKK